MPCLGGQDSSGDDGGFGMGNFRMIGFELGSGSWVYCSGKGRSFVEYLDDG